VQVIRTSCDKAWRGAVRFPVQLGYMRGGIRRHIHASVWVSCRGVKCVCGAWHGICEVQGAMTVMRMRCVLDVVGHAGLYTGFHAELSIRGAVSVPFVGMI
jgi:hypothetical protein